MIVSSIIIIIIQNCFGTSQRALSIDIGLWSQLVTGFPEYEKIKADTQRFLLTTKMSIFQRPHLTLLVQHITIHTNLHKFVISLLGICMGTWYIHSLILEDWYLVLQYLV